MAGYAPVPRRSEQTPRRWTAAAGPAPAQAAPAAPPRPTARRRPPTELRGLARSRRDRAGRYAAADRRAAQKLPRTPRAKSRAHPALAGPHNQTLPPEYSDARRGVKQGQAA